MNTKNTKNIFIVFLFIALLFTILSYISDFSNKESFFSFILSPNTKTNTIHSGSPYPEQINPRHRCLSHIRKNNCST